MFKAKFTEDAPMAVTFSSEGEMFGVSFSEVQKVYMGIKSGSTAHWDAQKTLIGEENFLYVYTDHQSKTDSWGRTTHIPGFKVGDGKTLLSKLPFTDDIYSAHVINAAVHCTQAEKDLWNGKIRAVVSKADPENLIFTSR